MTKERFIIIPVEALRTPAYGPFESAQIAYNWAVLKLGGQAGANWNIRELEAPEAALSALLKRLVPAE